LSPGNPGGLRACEDPEEPPDGYYYVKAAFFREAYLKLEDEILGYRKLNDDYQLSLNRQYNDYEIKMYKYLDEIKGHKKHIIKL
jgi:hypothetical protein